MTNDTIGWTRLIEVVRDTDTKTDHTPRWAYACVAVGSLMLLVSLVGLVAVRWASVVG